MRLKKLKLSGFKSFVDPTSIEFPSQLVSIVGPNGCGKSNIIDAIRWVMGESSAKYLRGEALTDVIFNGSSARKPVGQASVELLFDNALGKLAGEYASYSEISVKRILTRDGQSTYLLNNTKCRRRDITDIILGTGVGPRSYSVIEQGMISRLVEAKPDELRAHIDEVAGIAKYKDRRRETEYKIKHTRENLERLEDLRQELHKQLEHLHRQKQAAEKYKALKSDQELREKELKAIRWQELENDITNKQVNYQKQETTLEKNIANLREMEAQLEVLRQSHLELNDNLQSAQAQYYRQGAEVTNIEQQITHHQSQLEQLQQDLENTNKQHIEANHQLESDKKRFDELDAEYQASLPQIEQARAIYTDASVRLDDADKQVQKWQEEWEAFVKQASERTKIAEVEQTKIEQYERQLIQLEKSIERLEAEKSSMAFEPLKVEIEAINEKLLDSDEKINVLENLNDSQKSQFEAHKLTINEYQSKHADLKTKHDKLVGQKSSLTALQQAALGKDSNVLENWLKNNNLNNLAKIGEKLSVEKGYEQAVETILSHAIQGLCVESLEDVKNKVLTFKAGELLLLEQSDANIDSSTKEDFIPLSSKVKSNLPIYNLLAGIYCAEDLDFALKNRKQLKAHELFVTKDGQCVGKHWLKVINGEKDETSGFLVRKAKLEALEQDICALINEMDLLSEELANEKEQIQSVEIARDNTMQELATCQRENAADIATLKGKQSQLSQLETRSSRIDEELTENRAQLIQFNEQTKNARQLLSQVLDDMAEDNRQRPILQNQKLVYQDSLHDARKAASEYKENMLSLSARIRSLEEQTKTYRENINRATQQVAQLTARIDKNNQIIASHAQPIPELENKLKAALESKLSDEHKMQTIKNQVEEVSAQLSNLESARFENEKIIQANREQLQKLELDLQAVGTRKTILEEEFDNDTNNIKSIISELPDDASQAGWEEEIQRLANRIGRLGAINLAAIEEYETQSERKIYLDRQHEDLTSALETLEKAIEKIDKETKQLFKDTFDFINQTLQSLFPQMFNGGQASLELTDADLLTTGVTIMARPPGKRNSTIHLLSGGEKALTAIALIFSIFKLNPAPFCILDEVDAPLDDANVRRFCKLVKEMSKTVQFIFITHNKVTMELAEQFMGVTMREPGVSRIVSVDVNAAVEMAV